MSNGILLVGGYGAVGAAIAAALMPDFEEQVIIAGRNAARAKEFASTLSPKVRWRAVDLAAHHDYQAVFAGVQYVVACLDIPDIEFVHQCFQRGIHYIDISAEYGILSAIAALDETAKQAGTTAVLSVGLVPGLSNLLAQHSLSVVAPIDLFDAALLTGLGEKHASWAQIHKARGPILDRGFDRARNPHWLRPTTQAYRVRFVNPRHFAGENWPSVPAPGGVKSAEICSRPPNEKRVDRPVRFLLYVCYLGP
jgi:hypothetical protein